MKKILILNWWDLKNPKAGGAEVHLNEIFSRLIKKDYKITLVCSNFLNSKRQELINGIRVIRIAPWWLINLASLFWFLKNKDKFDLVIDYTNKIPYLTPLYIKKKPIIGIAHHVFGEIWLKEWGLVGKIFRYFERLSHRVYRETPIIAVSQSTKEELINIGFPAKNIQVIYNGISAPLKTGGKSRSPLIVYLGRLKKYKRIDLILEAMPEIIKIYPGIQLIIMGSGSDERRLKKITTKNKIQSHVKFLGFVSESLKWAILRKAWLNIQPSIKEGWGFSVLEAAACGTPSIVAFSPGLKETVIQNKTGWLFERENSRTLKKTLLQILEDNQKRMIASKFAFNFAHQFNWSKSAQEFRRLIDKV